MRTEFCIPSQNQLKKWGRLADSKFRWMERLFLAEGVKVVQELLSGNWSVKAMLVLPEKIKYWNKIIDSAPPDAPVYELSRQQWQKLSQDKEPEGIMAVIDLPPEPSFSAHLISAPHNVLILQEINNPVNLGALLRSALWFGFNSVILSSDSADYTHPKAVRASMGSLFHLTLISHIDLKKVLPDIKKYYYLIGSLVRGGRSPHFLQKKAALLLGSESHGVNTGLLSIADEIWSIPGSGRTDSLSLPQAAAIMMYECAKDRW